MSVFHHSCCSQSSIADRMQPHQLMGLTFLSLRVWILFRSKLQCYLYCSYPFLKHILSSLWLLMLYSAIPMYLSLHSLSSPSFSPETDMYCIACIKAFFVLLHVSLGVFSSLLIFSLVVLSLTILPWNTGLYLNMCLAIQCWSYLLDCKLLGAGMMSLSCILHDFSHFLDV